jgi:hypothetical protein
VKNLERLVVHVEEAIRLGTSENEPELRLGLLLIDSAAELMLYRETDYLLAWGDQYQQWLDRAEQAAAHGYASDQDYIDELRGKVFSKTQRNKIEHDFDAKCALLVEQDILQPAQARVLKKLHEYRNETYHRDELRPATLASANRIYIYLVCQMMIVMPVHSMSFSGPVAPAVLNKYLKPGENGFGVGVGLQARIGQALIATTSISNTAELGQELSEHVNYRLDEIEAAGEECVSFFNSMNDRGWTSVAILGMLQAPEPSDPFDHLRRTPDDYRNKWARPVNKAKFRTWRKAAAELANETDDLAAFAAFADLEDAFEPIEKQVMRLALDVDREIQNQVDQALGK